MVGGASVAGKPDTPPGKVAYDIVSEALRLGYRHLDTAGFYENEAYHGYLCARCMLSEHTGQLDYYAPACSSWQW